MHVKHVSTCNYVQCEKLFSGQNSPAISFSNKNFLFRAKQKRPRK